MLTDVARMTPRQTERREAIVAAVVELVAERGVDDLQMRDVAERAGVSLGTPYRYFGSKDHLVAVAFMAWASNLDRRLTRAQVLGAADHGPAERLVEALRVGVRPFQRQPNFARMLIAVGSSTDPQASETYLGLGRAIRHALGRAIPDVDPDTREAVLQVIGSVWYHAFVEWMGGRITVAQVHERLAGAARLLLGER